MSPENTLDGFIRGQRTGESQRGQLLEDIRVIDLATVLAAPFAATLLGDYGAEVIKVENPAVPDAIRKWGVLEGGIQPFWLVFGRNKFPVTVNLKSPAGKKLFFKLVAQSDVLIDNMRPGAMEKLGFDTGLLHELNPGLIIGRVSGYGQSGPYSAKPGFGTLAEGFSGYTYLNTQPGGVPTNPPLALADFVAGLFLAFAITMALRDQKRGKNGGRVIDISLYEPLFSLFGADFLTCCLTGEVPEPKGNELSYVVPRNNYQAKDGKWVALSTSAQKPFERLMAAIGHPEMSTDQRYSTNEERIKDENREMINRVIGEWIAGKSLEEIMEVSDDLGITVGPITTMKDIARDRHYKERGSWIEIEDPVTKTPLKMPNVAFRFLDAPNKVRFAGLPHGSANMVIFQDLLGYSCGEIEQLKADRAI